MIQSETRYDIMTGVDEGGFWPSGLSEGTLKEAEAKLKRARKDQPEIYCNAFICETVTKRIAEVKPEVNHEHQTIPTAG
jgi:hypothetical protein